jgi:hypothetical protein
MTVRDLIAELMQCDPDLPVVIWDDMNAVFMVLRRARKLDVPSVVLPTWNRGPMQPHVREFSPSTPAILLDCNPSSGS